MTAATRGLAAAGLCVTVAACGGEELPRAAEPADSPPLASRPAGTSFEVGAEPEGIALDPVTGILAVSLQSSDELVLVRVPGGEVLRRIALPASARHLALARPGGPVLVPAESADRLITVELPGGELREVEVGAFPHTAAFADGRVFVADERGDSVTVVEDNIVVDSLDAPQQPGGIAATGDRVGLIAVRERVLQVYDAAALEPLGETAAGVGPTHIVAARGVAFVADTDGDRVLVFRLGAEPRQIGSTPAIGAPYGIALDPRHRLLWVTLTARNRALAFRIDGSELRRLASYPTVRQPNGIAADPRDGSAYVAGRAGERIQRLPAPAGVGP